MNFYLHKLTFFFLIKIHQLSHCWMCYYLIEFITDWIMKSRDSHNWLSNQHLSVIFTLKCTWEHAKSYLHFENSPLDEEFDVGLCPLLSSIKEFYRKQNISYLWKFLQTQCRKPEFACLISYSETQHICANQHFWKRCCIT